MANNDKKLAFVAMLARQFNLSDDKAVGIGKDLMRIARRVQKLWFSWTTDAESERRRLMYRAKAIVAANGLDASLKFEEEHGIALYYVSDGVARKKVIPWQD